MRRYGWLVLTLMLVLSVIAPVFAQEIVTHTVQRGDNLYRIALRYGVTVDELISANSIASPSRIFAGTALTIPGLAPVTSNPDIAVNPLVSAAPVNHTVLGGESLNMIAAAYDVSVENILRANNIANSNLIFSGQVLQIFTNTPDAAASAEVLAEIAAAPVVETEPIRAVTTHTVRPGEYLSEIARNYGVNWTVVAAMNSISDPNNIYAGMVLDIPASGTQSIDYGILNAQTLPDPGAYVGVGREVVVILSTQMTYAYEDGVLMRSVLTSTGLPATPTVQGDYAIYQKYDAQLMSGPSYYLPGVQWVMYFYQGYALHGTYWHSNWGNPMSHGCVNMPNEEAAWFYNFASIGTPVHVRWA